MKIGDAREATDGQRREGARALLPVRGPRRAAIVLAALAATVSVTSVSAQTSPPTAGQLLQQTAPSTPPPSPGQNQGVETPPVQPPAQTSSSATVQVKTIHVSGNTHIDEATLRQALPQIAQIEGTSATLAQLQAIADAVTRYYREHGYFVAVAYVPGQTVDDGVVTITVLEGKLDQTHVGQNGGYSPARLQRYANAALCGNTAGCTNAGLTRARADRAVGLISSLPGVASASGTLSPGAEVGTSDFTLDAVPGSSITGAVGIDNYGNEYTGRVRETGNFRWNNPLGIGDLFTAGLAWSAYGGFKGSSGRGALNGVVDYSVPVGYDGWRVGINYTHLLYQLGAPFDVTNSHGSGDEANVYATYPLLLAPDRHLWVRVSTGAKWLSDKVLDYKLNTRDTSVVLSVNGDAIDTLGGGGYSRYAASLTSGNVAYGSGSLPFEPHNAGHFIKFNASASRDQTLAYFANNTQRLSLYAAVQGQLSNTNLASVDQFSLGGPAGVRGYPVGEGVGDEGAIVTLELHHSFAVPALGGDNLTLSLFRDDGWIRTSHTPWAGYQGPVSRHLGSTGVGVELLRQNRYSLKAMWAVRDHGSGPDTATSDHPNWFWFQAVFFF